MTGEKIEISDQFEVGVNKVGDNFKRLTKEFGDVVGIQLEKQKLSDYKKLEINYLLGRLRKVASHLYYNDLELVIEIIEAKKGDPIKVFLTELEVTDAEIEKLKKAREEFDTEEMHLEAAKGIFGE